MYLKLANLFKNPKGHGKNWKKIDFKNWIRDLKIVGHHLCTFPKEI